MPRHQLASGCQHQLAAVAERVPLSPRSSLSNCSFWGGVGYSGVLLGNDEGRVLARHCTFVGNRGLHGGVAALQVGGLRRGGGGA